MQLKTFFTALTAIACASQVVATPAPAQTAAAQRRDLTDSIDFSSLFSDASVDLSSLFSEASKTAEGVLSSLSKNGQLSSLTRSLNGVLSSLSTQGALSSAEAQLSSLTKSLASSTATQTNAASGLKKDVFGGVVGSLGVAVVFGGAAIGAVMVL